MAQIIDPMELRTQQINASARQPRSPAPPKNRKGNDFSLAKQRTDVMNTTSPTRGSLTADGYWIIRRLIRGEHVTQENSGLAPTEWRDLMHLLGREASPA